MSHSIAVVAALIALNTGGHALAQDMYIDIGEASLTLNEWGRQTGVQILFDYQLIHGIYTNKVVCDCTAAESLQQLIRHLGLKYDFVNPRTVAVTPSFVSLPPPVKYPTVEEYERWFDRAGYFQPAHAYPYEMGVESAKMHVVLPNESL